jgi:hypothetical protein
MLLTRVVGAVAMVALLPLLLAGAPGGAADREQAEVLKAVKAFGAAAGKGDLPAMREAAVWHPKMEPLFEASAELASVNRKFNDAMARRFGKDAAVDYAGLFLKGMTDTHEDYNDKPQVKIEGKTATVEGEFGVRALVRTGQGWKVDFTAAPTGAPEKFHDDVQLLRVMSRRLGTATQALEAGWVKDTGTVRDLIGFRAEDPEKERAKEWERPKDGDDARVARACAKRMIQALLSGDAQATQALYVGKTDLGPALDTFTTLRSASQKLHRSLAKRFPSLVQGGSPDQVDIGPDLLVAIDDARVRVDGDTAVVRLLGDWDPMLLRRGEGRWNVVQAPSLERFLAPARATATALEEAAGEVDAGKYSTAKAFRAALAEKVRAAAERASQPTTRPVRG